MGAFELAIVAAFGLLFGPGVLAHSVALWAMTLGGVLALLAGSVAAVDVGSVRATWRHLFGASSLASAATMPISYAPHVHAGTASGEELLTFGAGVGTALRIGFVGVDVARDGRHFQITGDVERVLSL